MNNLNVLKEAKTDKLTQLSERGNTHLWATLWAEKIRNRLWQLERCVKWKLEEDNKRRFLVACTNWYLLLVTASCGEEWPHMPVSQVLWWRDIIASSHTWNHKPHIQKAKNDLWSIFHPQKEPTDDKNLRMSEELVSSLYHMEAFWVSTCWNDSACPSVDYKLLLGESSLASGSSASANENNELVNHLRQMDQ